MSKILAIYHGHQPSFPATDQHPDAVRSVVGLDYVDAIGGAPTQAEVDAFLNAGARDADALSAELTSDKALDDLGRAIDQGDTKTALTLVKQLLQEKR